MGGEAPQAPSACRVLRFREALSPSPRGGGRGWGKSAQPTKLFTIHYSLFTKSYQQQPTANADGHTPHWCKNSPPLKAAEFPQMWTLASPPLKGEVPRRGGGVASPELRIFDSWEVPRKGGTLPPLKVAVFLQMRTLASPERGGGPPPKAVVEGFIAPNGANRSKKHSLTLSVLERGRRNQSVP